MDASQSSTGMTPALGGPEGRLHLSSDDFSRIGVVDLGSNSVRLVVFDGAARSPAYFFNEKILCGLGAGLSETGRLNPTGRERALRALQRFAILAKQMRLPPLTVVATAAMRDAEDGPEFSAEILEKTGLVVRIIEGVDEARLSAQGVLLGWPDAKGLISDIGGSSMELALVADRKVGRCETSKLGPLKLQDLQGGRSMREAYVVDALQHLRSLFPEHNERLFLVGGSWRAIARVDMERRGYPLMVQHEYNMTPTDLRHTLEFIARSDIDKLRKRCGISEQRMALVPLAAEVLGPLVEIFAPEEIAVSAYGIREGVLYEQMPEDIRARDPLLEACHFAEAKDARNPGFGAQLFNFVQPLFAEADARKTRLIRAACSLHDVSWRAHPDYRAEVCFDYATRANLGGLTHAERIWLGLALLHRYKNKSDNPRLREMFELLDEEARHQASILGRAMRLGAMLWSLGRPENGASLHWSAETGSLELRLSAKIAPLFGEVAQTRLRSLANALDIDEAQCVILPTG